MNKKKKNGAAQHSTSKFVYNLFYPGHWDNY